MCSYSLTTTLRMVFIHQGGDGWHNMLWYAMVCYVMRWWCVRKFYMLLTKLPPIKLMTARGDCNTGLPYRVRILFKKEKEYSYFNR